MLLLKLSPCTNNSGWWHWGIIQISLDPCGVYEYRQRQRLLAFIEYNSISKLIDCLFLHLNKRRGTLFPRRAFARKNIVYTNVCHNNPTRIHWFSTAKPPAEMSMSQFKNVHHAAENCGWQDPLSSLVVVLSGFYFFPHNTSTLSSSAVKTRRTRPGLIDVLVDVSFKKRRRRRRRRKKQKCFSSKVEC